MKIPGSSVPRPRVEEEVLLPVLDETMTPEEFEREIASQGHPLGH